MESRAVAPERGRRRRQQPDCDEARRRVAGRMGERGEEEGDEDRGVQQRGQDGRGPPGNAFPAALRENVADGVHR